MKEENINPSFEGLNDPERIKKHINALKDNKKPITHESILGKLLNQLTFLDFQGLAFPEAKELRNKLQILPPDSSERSHINNELIKKKVSLKDMLVLSVQNLQTVAVQNSWGLCKNQDFIYVYNGAYWSNIDMEAFRKFLGEAAEKMGVNWREARYYQFRDHLLKQFLATAYLSKPEPPADSVRINLKNGTFVISPNEMKLRPFNSEDFITYQLPFEYDDEAKAPIFHQYLDRVLPDKERQAVLAEFLGYVFIRNGSSTIKEEKALILYGSGANGKSVFFEIVNALLGNENVCSYSLQSLTDTTGYHRAMIANKLVNYASEINGKLEASFFKQLISGEPVEARLPYGNPMLIRQYAKLIFNCNELPREVEHSDAYFRRFLIIPFDVTIPEAEQDKQLHIKIIQKELSGIFNWVLAGLSRLVEQKHFSDCKAARQEVEQYRKNSDTVQLFLDEYSCEPCATNYEFIKTVYADYRYFCNINGFSPLHRGNFCRRLKQNKYIIDRKNTGMVVFLSKGQAN
jgi:putative DNA primase/helicase